MQSDHARLELFACLFDGAWLEGEGGAMEPRPDFAIVVFDPMSDASPMKLVLQGPEVETWDSATCEERARLLDHAKPQVVLREVRLAAGMCIEALSLSEPSPPRVVVVGGLTDKSLCATAGEEGAFDRTLPPFEIEALVQILKGSANSPRNKDGTARVRAAA